MIKQHAQGILMGILIILVGILINPFSANAEELHWGFKKAKDEVPSDAGSPFNEILDKHGAIYKGNAEEKILYLTFDNGYEAGYTESILDTLDKEGVPATFFLTGHYLTSATSLVKRMVSDGHIIGNHSYDHPNMANLSAKGMEDEWTRFDKKLKELTGVERTIYVRPPKGIFNEKLLSVGNELGYRHIFWSVAFVDWHEDKPKGKDYAYRELMKQIHPGAIILMHTVSPDNAEALPSFIQDAQKEGYTFKSLDDLVMEYEEIFPVF
ncbi:delta-lactam-biosynthetic de-N-acetylase [Sporosarcina pasteurii]|uniref:Probable polysaccharide deacetylase pdaA n=1 Tax=Sporosarcina pasteurii TaxID=1474 RepID=A0A380CCH3_SPOPA|nr:delta-lactam-biosynthetic de-N-acetylase [Sporosarcina pasteurii]MDS9473338.1 delta-lactam-biosynthetic de-N-acetylase [Sporosarcina pasteurii]QBQ04279.1 delta-lactam-biosynthetic de-N-acetylase [Sporosarcina pasteurii]SUJ16722.1 Probable polysaccharide deacetylase pdaA precursor [Sporosarcina pasteurii]